MPKRVPQLLCDLARIMSRGETSVTLPVELMKAPRQTAAETEESPRDRKRGSLAILQQYAGDEAALVEGVMARNPRAVAQLFDSYAQVVRGVLIHALGGCNDVDDLMQETFLTVVRRCSTLRDVGALRSFIVSIAIRTARNELRKRAVRRLIGLDDAPLPPITPPHDPEVAQGISHLYQALSRLDADSRLAFTVRHVQGYELTETADICGCSLATIKRRLAKAEKCFESMAENDPVLRHWLQEGRDGS